MDFPSVLNAGVCDNSAAENSKILTGADVAATGTVALRAYRRLNPANRPVHRSLRLTI
jgi:hypothetical protein